MTTEKLENESFLFAPIDLAFGILKPVVGVLQDVSFYYSQKLYKAILANRNQKRYYRMLMKKANCYEQWAAAGFMLDRSEGYDIWKNLPVSNEYDYELLKDRLTLLKTLRKSGDISAMIFNLRTNLARNLGDMGNPRLYENSHVGTKALIEDYIDEVTKQLHFIADAEIPGMPIAEKLIFFKNIQLAFGRSALLLSGGGTFGLSHIGVIKALWEQKLLPRVITGSSAGSIVAGIFCCKTEKEIQQIIDPRHVNLNFFENPSIEESAQTMISRFLNQGVIRDIKIFNECMIENLGDITFSEAYNRTRRILNITVSSSTNYEMPRLLNHLTAPNLLIRSAIAASSAVPFVFNSAPLMAKDANKNIVPWNPSGHLWLDGSLESDLPMKRIAELFGVNHYCVAQTNPHIIPFLNSSENPSNFLTRSIKLIGTEVRAELQHRFSQIIGIGIQNSLIFKLHSILNQTYVGDITIVPYLPWSTFLNILSNPTVDMARRYTNYGERSTWPSGSVPNLEIAIMRNHCSIEMCISQNIIRLREKLVTDHSKEITPLLTSISFAPSPLSALPIMESEDSQTKIDNEKHSTQVTFASQDEILHVESHSKLLRSHRSAGDVRGNIRRPSLITPVIQDQGDNVRKFSIGLTFDSESECSD